MLNRPLQRAKEICKVAYTVEVLLCNVMPIWNEVFVNISRSGLLKHSNAIYFYILHILKLMKYLKTVDDHETTQPAAFI